MQGFSQLVVALQNVQNPNNWLAIRDGQTTVVRVGV